MKNKVLYESPDMELIFMMKEDIVTVSGDIDEGEVGINLNSINQ